MLNFDWIGMSDFGHKTLIFRHPFAEIHRLLFNIQISGPKVKRLQAQKHFLA
jgi:hypothetical protein